MKYLALFIFLPILLFAQIDTVISRAENFIAQENYVKGFKTLNKELFNSPLDSLSKAKIQNKLAFFNEKYVGDLEKSLQFFNQVSEANLPGNHPLIQRANEKIENINSILKKYEDVNKEFKEFKILSYRQNTDKEFEDLNSNLKQILISSPDYYRKAEILYFLGNNYMKREKFRKANRYFRMALEEKPAIDYIAPVSSYLKNSVINYRLTFARKFSTIFLSLFIFSTIILFYRMKPWNWYSWRHLKLLIILLISWALFYFIVFFIVGKGIENFHIKNNTFLNRVVFLYFFPFKPGGHSSIVLFLYGLYAVLGLYIFSIGAYMISNKWTRNIVLPLVGFLLFISMNCAFYIKNIHQKGEYKNSREAIWLRSYQYNIKEIEPYMLINPKAYHNLDVEEVPNDILLEWILENCPFDKEFQKELHE